MSDGKKGVASEFCLIIIEELTFDQGVFYEKS